MTDRAPLTLDRSPQPRRDVASVTDLLQRWSAGDREAFDQLVAIVYDELKRLAHARRRREFANPTLNTTGLVSEAWLKLVDVERVQWNDRNHFMSMAARTMRRVLVDQARKRSALKRRGEEAESPVVDPLIGDDEAMNLIALDEALDKLRGEHPRPGKVLELLCFGGFTQSEVGNVLGISQPTVARDLRFARAWLVREFGDA